MGNNSGLFRGHLNDEAPGRNACWMVRVALNRRWELNRYVLLLRLLAMVAMMTIVSMVIARQDTGARNRC